MKPALNTEAETANMLADTRYISRRGGRARARPHLPLAGTDWRRRRQPRSLPATMGRAGPAHAGRPAARLRLRIAAAGRLLREQPRSRPARAPCCRCAPPSAGSKARSISKPRNCGPWWPAAAKAGSTNTASASPRATATTCTTVASGRCTGARKTCRPTKASLTWSTKSPRCSRNTASTTCAAFLGLLPPDYCEDCGAPYFPNPLGELVHAELPEDAEAAPAKFH